MIIMDQITTNSNTYSIHHVADLQINVKTDIKNDIMYIEKENFLDRITGSDSETQYINYENLQIQNHIELFGQEAIEFDEAVKSVTRNNNLMTEILKEINENRITDA
ncbi:hypothetical protein [Marispirochaeta aestuarii]|uniref:hypothetical protein n=1 Tax=Marispirochaeta aestuarii TaxID=1963862 RepID=UPI0029C8BA63|nr:hypothetical protein [Marispirochaeta aestuarii]